MSPLIRPSADRPCSQRETAWRAGATESATAGYVSSTIWSGPDAAEVMVTAASALDWRGLMRDPVRQPRKAERAARPGDTRRPAKREGARAVGSTASTWQAGQART